MARSRQQRRFTPQSIERLKYDPAAAPPSGRMEIEDEVCPGLVLRVTPRGVKSFSVIYKVPGEGGANSNGRLLTGAQHRITLGATPPLGLTEAREQARKIIQAATEGFDPRNERRERNLIRHSNTFTLASERFVELELKPNVKAWKTIGSTLRTHVGPEWGDKPIQDIRRSDVHELLDGLVGRGKMPIAREVRKHLSRFFNWAIDREIIKDSPVHGLKRGDLEVNEEAGRALTDAELRHVWQGAASLGYPFGPMYQLLMLTGQRRNEWADASRSEINADKRWLEVPKARYKGKRDHIVPIADEAWAIFDTLPIWPGNDYFLLSSRDGEVPVSGFSKAKLRLDEAALAAMQKDDPEAKLAYFRVHDFRVTCECAAAIRVRLQRQSR
ncbi:tyrosine-type recombinase/integrase [Bradyrhizobium brasilense]|uniref:Integrase arm-type DNA-binding domain-containing protein n=1 Tax=Bradyrhizobium brasilense TaxID=1419277 RepID=A0ABY8JGV8_9BRAD|nr:integrase arm-type DNA-binding domain-containing protein [Bradyrhizobium brasilense]WFU64837.1 integrase arm-type DNA-binding domain-containing protein [Bradyrhizobium brasilense]